MPRQLFARADLQSRRNLNVAPIYAGSKVICCIILVLSVSPCLRGESPHELRSPADEIRAAAADIETLPLELRAGTRYLTLYNIEPARRMETAQVVSYTLNALSRTRAISAPAQVTPTLLRFNMAQYASQKDELAAWIAAWEKLAETDPYFHLRTEIAARRTIAAAKKSPLHPLTPSPLHSQTVTADGGWVDLTAAAKLRAATDSTGALLRADYFVSQATVAPRYYEFAGVPESENEFLKALGVDEAVIDRLRANAGANLIISGVTSKPRRVVWAQGPLGGVYSTLDVETVDAARDPLRRPISVTVKAEGGGGKAEKGNEIETASTSASRSAFRLPNSTFAFKFDVSEWFAMAPNGLWRTALFDAAGKRQNSVPDKVAKDTSDPLGDGVVVPLVSCIRCHRESGLRPFRDDQTTLLAGHVDLYSYDPSIVQRAAEFYDEPRLQRQMKFDRETYAAAVERATTVQAQGPLRQWCPPSLGFSPDQLVDALAAVVRRFAYLPLTPDEAASEVGLSPSEFKRLLAPTHDPVILVLIEGRNVLRGQWDSSFAEAALAAATYSPPRRRDAEKSK